MMGHNAAFDAEEVDPIAAVVGVVCHPAARSPPKSPAFLAARPHFGVVSRACFFRTRFHFGEDKHLIFRIPREQVDFVAIEPDVLDRKSVV